MLRISAAIVTPFAAAGLLVRAATGDPSPLVMLLATGIATAAMAAVVREGLRS